MWISRAKLCRITPGERNDSRVSLQELDFVYMFWADQFGCVMMV